MKYINFLTVVILLLFATTHQLTSQEKQLLDSIETVYKPNIIAIKDSIKTVKAIKKEIIDSIADINKSNAAVIPYNSQIKDLRLSLKATRHQYSNNKKEIITQVSAYHKKQDYYKYKKRSFVANGMGIACKVASMFFFVNFVSTRNNSENFLIPSIACAALGGGFFTYAAVNHKKYQNAKSANKGFKLTASPIIFQQQARLSYGLGLNFTF